MGGLGKNKIALVGAFGSIDQENISIASIPEAKETFTEDIPSTPSTPSLLKVVLLEQN